MLSYFCEERTTEFCKVINDSADYRILDNTIVFLVVPLIFYLLFNIALKLRNANFKSLSKIKLVKAVFNKLGALYLFVFVASLAYVAFAYLATFYSRHVGYGFSTDPAVWGQAGDFFAVY
jgi:ABC-type polysaccharide transport system permease subunit